MYCFVGEFLVLIGAFKTQPRAAVLAATGVILAAAYLLWTMQRVFLGELNTKYEDLTDMSPRELVTLVPLGVIVIILGVWPMPVLNLIAETLDFLVIHVGNTSAGMAGF